VQKMEASVGQKASGARASRISRKRLPAECLGDLRISGVVIRVRTGEGWATRV
jgi:hypothetical protein